VGFLLEHCPKTFRLVIAGRSHPPLPITRLQARDSMVQLGAKVNRSLALVVLLSLHVQLES
jgi:ATP/maltotriose-dependent transcriptional regulator MalT